MGGLVRVSEERRMSDRDAFCQIHRDRSHIILRDQRRMAMTKLVPQSFHLSVPYCPAHFGSQDTYQLRGLQNESFCLG